MAAEQQQAVADFRSAAETAGSRFEAMREQLGFAPQNFDTARPREKARSSGREIDQLRVMRSFR